MNNLPAPLQNNGFKYSETVAHAIAKALKRHGITVTFGQSLPSMLHLACEEAGIRQIAYRTENAGGCMADAFARVSGKPAIVTGQNGPAATLLVAPLAEALKASIPVIALVQEVNRDQADRNAFQEFDHLGLFAPCAKFVRRVTVASRIEDYIDMAFTAACTGRPGPAVLLLPADLLQEPATGTNRTVSLGQFPLDRVGADEDSIAKAADLIAAAKKPVVIAGGGIHSSRAWAELEALQNLAHIPVATTVMGKGSVSEAHPLTVGVVANFLGPNSSTRSQKSLVADADVVLLVGNRTNQNGTDSWTLYPKNAKYIHIDIDGQEVGRNYEALRLVGDAKLVLKALTKELGSRDLSQAKANRAHLEDQIASNKAKDLAANEAVRTSPNSPIRPERMMHELNKRLKPSDIVVADASYSSLWISNYLTSQRAGMRFLSPRGLAGLGWGLPMALGAKVASPESTVYCLVGDGGFGHVWSELETAKRMGIKVILMVINNGILGFQKHAENVKYGAHTSAVDFAQVSHAKVAEGAGCVGITVSDASRIEEAFAQAEKAESTVLLDFICDENAFPPLTFFTPENV
jgi:acetolactate synthase-1/2/3 large subunit